MGYVYLIRHKDSDLYKIGFTNKTPEERLKELQSGNPFPLNLICFYKTENAQKIENLMHLQNKDNRVLNEWFRFDVEIEQNFLQECQKKEASAKFLIEHKKRKDSWDKWLKKRS